MGKRIKRFFKKRHSSKYIKDKAIINFILQHSEEEKIDYSKIKIPSFHDSSDSEVDGIKTNRQNNLNESGEAPEENPKLIEIGKIPNFNFSLLNFFGKDEKTENMPNFKSFLFK